ncbi:MAG: hypothetical protein AB8E82_07625 [Aureispira sp.]
MEEPVVSFSTNARMAEEVKDLGRSKGIPKARDHTPEANTPDWINLSHPIFLVAN